MFRPLALHTHRGLVVPVSSRLQTSLDRRDLGPDPACRIPVNSFEAGVAERAGYDVEFHPGLQ